MMGVEILTNTHVLGKAYIIFFNHRQECLIDSSIRNEDHISKLL